MSIRTSVIEYETWLRQELAGDVVEKDLDEKHEKMKESPFLFLRATYWRWAEIIADVLPEMSMAPVVLAVGDIHVENFGTWRDVDGRLVWGVNDFDEAAEMPYLIDLVRLAVSAFLGSEGRQATVEPICKAILAGYANGLRVPKPVVLDREHRRMTEMFVASETERRKFWDKMDSSKHAGQYQPKERYLVALGGAMPEIGIEMKVWPRSAGTGSLGRPRWVALGEWKGGPVVREAKAIVPSAWNRVPGRGAPKIAVMEIARGHFRAPDPWYHLTGENVIVRRLSPNNRKIEVEDKGTGLLLDKEMLEAMGHELANIHLGVEDRGKAIKEDLGGREERWLIRATEKAAEATVREFKEWKKDH